MKKQLWSVVLAGALAAPTAFSLYLRDGNAVQGNATLTPLRQSFALSGPESENSHVSVGTAEHESVSTVSRAASGALESETLASFECPACSGQVETRFHGLLTAAEVQTKVGNGLVYCGRCGCNIPSVDEYAQVGLTYRIEGSVLHLSKPASSA